MPRLIQRRGGAHQKPHHPSFFHWRNSTFPKKSQYCIRVSGADEKKEVNKNAIAKTVYSAAGSAAGSDGDGTDRKRGKEKQISEDFSISHIRPDDFQATVVIQNGFSLSKEENLTSIPTGSIIQHSDDGITRVFDSRGNQLIRSVDNDSPKIPTPKGVTSAVNINQIPNGSFVQVNDDGITNVFLDDTRILTVISPTKSGRDMMMVPSTNGWIESSYKRGITQLGQFIADWKVPSSPPNPATGSIIYIFNAIIPSGDTGIVQPVLEYNYARPHQWTAAPWYGSNGVYYRGSTINTAEGHTIRGTLGWNSNLNRWNIIIQDIGNGGY